MVSMADIEQLADKIVREFRPEKIILFGSHARGAAGMDSDVDLLIVMPHVGKSWRQAAEIRSRVRASFPLDLLVRTPAEVERRIKGRDAFIGEIAEQGIVLYAAAYAGMGG
jgi:uncharacterized protein